MRRTQIEEMPERKEKKGGGKNGIRIWTNKETNKALVKGIQRGKDERMVGWSGEMDRQQVRPGIG